jgi:SAM-dependent methyltransferase
VEEPVWAQRRREALAASLHGLELEDTWATRHPLIRLTRRPVTRVRRVLARIIFERKLDTTEDYIEPAHFHSERLAYEPTPWLTIRRALGAVGVSPDDVFLDFGSGKGRVLYEAAKRPFARVIGVEISAALNEVARANLERNRRKLRCHQFELITADAATYELPDDVTVVYLFSPFLGETFAAMLGSIVRSLERKPRRMRLLYVLPKLTDEVLATGRFKLVRVLPGGRRDVLQRRVALFESM